MHKTGTQSGGKVKAHRGAVPLGRLAEDARMLDRLAALGDAGMASGVDDTFDIDAFVADARASR